MKQFTVMGNNVSLSKSPKLFTYIFNTLNIDAYYSYTQIADFQELTQFFNTPSSMNYLGINITIPFKEKIANYCNIKSDIVKITDSSNCIGIRNNELYAHNTDSYGFNNLLKINNINLNDLSVVVLGSGGSARSIIYSLLFLHVKEIFILSRNKKTSKEIINKFSNMNNIPVKLYNAFKGCKNNILINCTPIGVNENTELQILDFIDTAKYCIDINYINNKLAKSIFSKYTDYYISGLDMFIFQALASLDIWFSGKLSEKLNYKELVEIIKDE